MTSPLLSWGRYPRLKQTAHPLFWGDDLSPALDNVIANHGTTLAYGNGRSYGDSCLAVSDHVLHMRSLDRFIRVDWKKGTVLAEAGVTLAEILSLSIPNGWFLSVSPGTQFVTLGGAIANDVHGKNHHLRGTFGNHVLGFNLFRLGEILDCSPTKNSELYTATIGGLGLTGVIACAEIQLIPIKSSQIQSSVVRFGSLAEFFALSKELDHLHEYSVAWIDCLATGAHTGRGVFIVGDHSPYGSLEVNELSKLSVPLTPPISLINNLSLRAFNTSYWLAHPAISAQKQGDYQPFFFPLDRIQHWNRVYGAKGFQQYQCVIPESIAEVVMKDLLAAIAESGQGSFLAVLKRCGDIQSPGLLSFPLEGTSLALDFPQRANLVPLFSRLDAIVREAGGRLYAAKDAHMSGSDFRRSYPEWEKLEALRDPLLISHFWKRVTE